MNTALQFGGGKDSLACLYLLEPRWSEITVAWINTGAAFPETRALMERIAKLVPHFLEIKSDVITDITQNGWPVDVLPIRHSAQGQIIESTRLKLRSWFDCCGTNMWRPLDAKMRELGVTEIVRGQRNQELYKSPVRDGTTLDGITYRFPLQDWTTEQVFDYLKGRGVDIPANYAFAPTSLDCWLCTAYLDEKAPQLHYTKMYHPNKHRVVVEKLTEIRAAIDRTYQPLQEAIYGR